MSTELVVVGSPDGAEETDLGALLANPVFEGMTLEYFKEVYDGVLVEEGEDAAWNFLECVKKFGGSEGSEFDLDSMGFDAEDGEESGNDLADGGGGERDPLRVATLVQSNTKRSKNVYPGQFLDKLLDDVVANTWDPDSGTEGRPLDVPGAVLVYHRSRTMFGEGKSPVCWSKDGVVNRHGGLCKDCPHVKSTTCTSQIIVVWLNNDYSHFYKLNFNKTALRVGNQLIKRLRAGRTPFSNACALTVEHESNNKGDWFKPAVAVTKTMHSDNKQKALRILAELYTAYFKGVKSQLKRRHDEYKEQKVLPGGGGIPGAQNALPPGGPGIGAGAAFMSTGVAAPSAPETPAVDLNALTQKK